MIVDKLCLAAKTEILGGKLPTLCHFLHQKSHIEWPENKLGPLRPEAISQLPGPRHGQLSRK